jgi:hypothetical protein
LRSRDALTEKTKEEAPVKNFLSRQQALVRSDDGIVPIPRRETFATDVPPQWKSRIAADIVGERITRADIHQLGYPKQRVSEWVSHFKSGVEFQQKGRPKTFDDEDIDRMKEKVAAAFTNATYGDVPEGLTRLEASNLLKSMRDEKLEKRGTN